MSIAETRLTELSVEEVIRTLDSILDISDSTSQVLEEIDRIVEAVENELSCVVTNNINDLFLHLFDRITEYKMDFQKSSSSSDFDDICKSRDSRNRKKRRFKSDNELASKTMIENCGKSKKFARFKTTDSVMTMQEHDSVASTPQISRARVEDISHETLSEFDRENISSLKSYQSLDQNTNNCVNDSSYSKRKNYCRQETSHLEANRPLSITVLTNSLYAENIENKMVCQFHSGVATNVFSEVNKSRIERPSLSPRQEELSELNKTPNFSARKKMKIVYENVLKPVNIWQRPSAMQKQLARMHFTNPLNTCSKSDDLTVILDAKKPDIPYKCPSNKPVYKGAQASCLRGNIDPLIKLTFNANTKSEEDSSMDDCIELSDSFLTHELDKEYKKVMHIKGFCDSPDRIIEVIGNGSCEDLVESQHNCDVSTSSLKMNSNMSVAEQPIDFQDIIELPKQEVSLLPHQQLSTEATRLSSVETWTAAKEPSLLPKRVPGSSVELVNSINSNNCQETSAFKYSYFTDNCISHKFNTLVSLQLNVLSVLQGITNLKSYSFSKELEYYMKNNENLTCDKFSCSSIVTDFSCSNVSKDYIENLADQISTAFLGNEKLGTVGEIQLKKSGNVQQVSTVIPNSLSDICKLKQDDDKPQFANDSAGIYPTLTTTDFANNSNLINEKPQTERHLKSINYIPLEENIRQVSVVANKIILASDNNITSCRPTTAGNFWEVSNSISVNTSTQNITKTVTNYSLSCNKNSSLKSFKQENTTKLPVGICSKNTEKCNTFAINSSASEIKVSSVNNNVLLNVEDYEKAIDKPFDGDFRTVSSNMDNIFSDYNLLHTKEFTFTNFSHENVLNSPTDGYNVNTVNNFSVLPNQDYQKTLVVESTKNYTNTDLVTKSIILLQDNTIVENIESKSVDNVGICPITELTNISLPPLHDNESNRSKSADAYCIPQPSCNTNAKSDCTTALSDIQLPSLLNNESNHSKTVDAYCVPEQGLTNANLYPITELTDISLPLSPANESDCSANIQNSDSKIVKEIDNGKGVENSKGSKSGLNDNSPNESKQIIFLHNNEPLKEINIKNAPVTSNNSSTFIAEKLVPSTPIQKMELPHVSSKIGNHYGFIPATKTSLDVPNSNIDVIYNCDNSNVTITNTSIKEKNYTTTSGECEKSYSKEFSTTSSHTCLKESCNSTDTTTSNLLTNAVPAHTCATQDILVPKSAVSISSLQSNTAASVSATETTKLLDINKPTGVKRPASDDGHKSSKKYKPSEEAVASKQNIPSISKNYTKAKETTYTNDPRWSLYNFSRPEDCFEVVRNQWCCSYLPNPHEDLTCRFSDRWYPFPSNFIIPGNNQSNTVECLTVYDDQINAVKHEMDTLKNDLDLYGSTWTKRRIRQTIDRLNKLRDIDTHLFKARDEAYHFYKYYQDPKTGWNARYISDYKRNEVVHQLQILDSYESFYGYC